MTTSGKYCVLGAGASGLTVVKNFLQAGIPCECLERHGELGGNWRFGQPGSSIYRSTHLISSKRLTEYTDFPMPDDWPAYPDHRRALDYLHSYARHFGLSDCILFNTEVRRVAPADNGWIVETAAGPPRWYRGLVIANGHHWDPRWPNYPGVFSGETIHSAQYKTPDALAGRRVLVVGGGNSGCDIAVESAQHAALTLHSTRRGYFYVPKFLFGKPADRCGEFLLRWRCPLWLRRKLVARLVKLAIGWPEDYGLPKPDHRFLETHPIINSQLLYYLGHGDITPKPDIARLDGQSVEFVDSSRAEVDVIVYATGFHISFPFIDREHLNWQGDRPDLYLHAFHPQHDHLFVAGMIQSDSGLWGLADYQAQLMARFVLAAQRKEAAADRFRQLKRADRPDMGGGVRYLGSPRHTLEVEHFSYRRRLQKMIAEFDG